jgi:hypothetical protein
MNNSQQPGPMTTRAAASAALEKSTVTKVFQAEPAADF